MVVAVWNLFLATLPAVLAVPLARRLRGDGASRSRARHPGTAALAAAWLLLLPNAPYLLTDLRHFVLDERWRTITAEARHDPAALREAAVWALLFLSYGAAGVVALTAAVRPVESALRARGVGTLAFRVPLFLLTSLGVWLGLVQRFNSWDALLRPLEVVGAALWAVTHPATTASVAGFACVLAGLHALLDAAWTGRPRALRARESARPMSGRNGTP